MDEEIKDISAEDKAVDTGRAETAKGTDEPKAAETATEGAEELGAAEAVAERAEAPKAAETIAEGTEAAKASSGHEAYGIGQQLPVYLL